MMSELNTIVNCITDVNNTIKIKRLSTNEIQTLSHLIVWESETFDGQKTIFGGVRFKYSLKEKGVLINTGSIIFDYEIKAIMVASLHLGMVVGGSPLEWKSVMSRVNILKRFCIFLQVRNYSSFRDMDELPELKLRNLLIDFMYVPKEEGGLAADIFTSLIKAARDSLKLLHIYGLVEEQPFSLLLDELTINKIRKHENQHRLKHSIIPTLVMKSLIQASTEYLNSVKANINSIIDTHKKANERIEGSGINNSKHIILSVKGKLKSDLTIVTALIKDLNLHVYTLILAFTGMRFNEVFELKNNCHSSKMESGEKIYTIRSLLSKTTEGVLELDWIANEVVFEAIDLLSKVNEVYKERAILLLEHQSHILSDSQIREYRYGLKRNRLLGISHNKGTVRFVTSYSLHDKGSFASLIRHSFKVTASDIEQLEKMGCNYQSVSQTSGKRGLKYKVGDTFNFTAHQFRHTFAWFIIANRLGDLDDIKYQFKHLKNMMSLIYSERGFESLNELRSVIEYFETLTNSQAIENIVESAKRNEVTGGGGDKLSKFLAKINSNQSQVIYTTAQQPHFNNTQELIDFSTKHGTIIRGLPHGYCTKGVECKIKNASDPSHCLYCDTYYVTPKHLPYWEAIKKSCENKIERINELPDSSKYQAYFTGLKDNLNAANKIIDKLTPALKKQS
ncbi:integrase [Psychrosphaera aquimarina]|uniref:Integrase n=1 Tax=Psychrosphaera aquimarina TaxID=2044854 RepID=A0ABU3QY03_9GAMM|nr:integrase [Psychrosphaera aquimarina]MDU0112293.1 integrase [Psychrosphaera aquimarina]